MRLPAFLFVGLLVSALASAAPKKEESRKEPTKPEPKPSVVIKADPRTGEPSAARRPVTTTASRR